MGVRVEGASGDGQRRVEAGSKNHLAESKERVAGARKGHALRDFMEDHVQVGCRLGAPQGRSRRVGSRASTHPFIPNEMGQRPQEQKRRGKENPAP